MLTLIIGLVLFLGVHSIRIFAEPWRNRQIAQYGENLWKAIFSVIAIAGLYMIITGYPQTRIDPVVIWLPPQWLKYTAAVLLFPTFILLIAAYVPGTRIKSGSGHPMAASIKLWAFMHLLANGTLGDILLFGSFTVWAIFDYRTARRRDRATATKHPVQGLARDFAVIILGIISWVLFAFYAHEPLIGVKPFA